ncbi:hypothetical protein GLOIN_2v1766788 [Rhizophagus irregularis DAOM 181602=DAOM 197198]|nr:hypothetical protein GLOIN_2v1766788 [Rhizophagus irregularis DAOM 181602=DAOM 197198]
MYISFLLLALDWRKAKAIIASRDISYAFTSTITSRRKKSLPIESLDPEIFTFKVETLWKAFDLVYMNEKRACQLDHWI